MRREEGLEPWEFHSALAAVRMGIRGIPKRNRGVRSSVPDQAKMISPSVRVRAWKPASSFAVTGPVPVHGNFDTSSLASIAAKASMISSAICW